MKRNVLGWRGKIGWLKASLFSQAILALYFQVMQWLPLGGWNYPPGFTSFGVQVMHGDASGQDFPVVF